MRICYIRHAEHKNDKLTNLGENQAEMVAEQLKEERPVKVYSSPLNRCLQTANIIARKLSLDVEVLPGLEERFKIEDPVTKDELESNENYLDYNYKSNNPSIETCRDYINANFKSFDYIINNHIKNNENVVIVAHSSTLYALNAYICGIPNDGKIVWMRAGNCAKVCYEKDCE